MWPRFAISELFDDFHLQTGESGKYDWFRFTTHHARLQFWVGQLLESCFVAGLMFSGCEIGLSGDYINHSNT